MKKLITFFFVCIFSLSVFAGGFQINEHGARPLGMGGAFTAVVNDASAIYWNGAGLININGTNFLAGTAMIAPSTTFMIDKTFPSVYTDYAEQKMVSQQFFPSHFFAAHKFTPDLAVGLGFTTPYGLGTKWEEDWDGSLLAIETSLQTYTISPVIAYRIVDQLSISAGFVYSLGNVEIIRRQMLSQTASAIVKMEGDESSAFGYNLGLMYQPTDRFSAGVAFRSQIEYNFEGTVASTPSVPALTTDISADLTTPMNLVFGVAYKFIPDLLISADFQYVGWSSYDSLTVEFASGLRASSPREYENSFIARLGGEYNISDIFALRAGVYFDKNPVKPERINPTLPESDRIGISAGFSYEFTKGFGVDLSYLFIHSNEITIDKSEERLISQIPATAFNGTYNSSAHIIALSLSYSL